MKNIKKYQVKSESEYFIDEYSSYTKPDKQNPRLKNYILKRVCISHETEWTYFVIDDGNNYTLKEYKNKELMKKTVLDASQLSVFIEAFLIWKHEGRNIHSATITSTVEVGRI